MRRRTLRKLPRVSRDAMRDLEAIVLASRRLQKKLLRLADAERWEHAANGWQARAKSVASEQTGLFDEEDAAGHA